MTLSHLKEFFCILLVFQHELHLPSVVHVLMRWLEWIFWTKLLWPFSMVGLGSLADICFGFIWYIKCD